MLKPRSEDRPEDDSGGRGRVLVEPTAEMRRWIERFGALIFARPDHLLAQLLRLTFVTPISHVAVMSFDFQCYLYAIFHRSRTARLLHIIAMPAIVLSTLALAGQISIWALYVVAAVLAAYYLAVAWRQRMALLGVVMVVVTAIMTVAAERWLGRILPTAVGARAILQQPAFWLLGLALVEALSHGAEHVPPRVSASDRWVDMQTYFFGPADNRHSFAQVLRRLARSTFMALSGMTNEVLGGWRLLLILVVRGMWRLGYQSERRDRLAALVNEALVHNNPAIDFIGDGGTSLHPLDAIGLGSSPSRRGAN